MKKMIAVAMAGISLILNFSGAIAQQTRIFKATEIASHELEIGSAKTTNLVFPYAIVSFDRGNKDILAQKATGVNNVLHVEAGKKNLPESNLTVVTSDGNLYAYTTRYNENPQILNIKYDREKKVTEIQPSALAIAFSKTTNLVFPKNIASVNRGNADILAQKANGVQNILQVKAGKANFSESNLTVVTEDGELYSYIVNYSETPASLNIRYDIGPDSSLASFGEVAALNDGEIERDATLISRQGRTVRGIKASEFGIDFRMEGIYIHQDIMYYQLRVKNTSQIDYDIDQFRFYVRDQQKAKLTASQELEYKPVYVYGDTRSVAGKSEQVFVFAISKFTIPDQKYLAVQVLEKRGGRHLELEVKNKKLIKAKAVN